MAKPDKDKFIKKAIAKFGDTFDYSGVEYINAETNVKIICPEHGAFFIWPKNHMRAIYGCPHCANEARSTGTMLPWEEVLARFKEVHGDRYDYSKSVYMGMFKPITIICSEHGEFSMLPVNHSTGQNCRACVLKLPAGETAPPVARRDSKRANVAKVTKPVFQHLNMLKVPTRPFTGEKK